MELIATTLISGGLTAGFLGISHHVLPQLFELHPVVNYVFGSASCLAALFLALLTRSSWQSIEIIILASGIWGLTGAIVALLYLLDGIASKQRKMERLTKRYGSEESE